MTTDHYAGTGRRWALGAELVYAPIAAQLICTCPHPLAGRTVLDAGAGTGAASRALAARRARPVAMDLSLGMLAWNAATRPASAVADIRALPLAADSVDRIGPDRAEGLARQAAQAIRPIMRPYRPVVVFLAGRVT